MPAVAVTLVDEELVVKRASDVGDFAVVARVVSDAIWALRPWRAVMVVWVLVTWVLSWVCGSASAVISELMSEVVSRPETSPSTPSPDTEAMRDPFRPGQRARGFRWMYAAGG